LLLFLRVCFIDFFYFLDSRALAMTTIYVIPVKTGIQKKQKNGNKIKTFHFLGFRTLKQKK
jgi:hypothetical protein